MPVEILGVFRSGGKYHAPIRRVRCTVCGSEYARTGCPSDIRKARGCSSCSQTRRKYASTQERRRAQNQRYYQRRKLREATT
jgi:hypothetical protein